MSAEAVPCYDCKSFHPYGDHPAPGLGPDEDTLMQIAKHENRAEHWLEEADSSIAQHPTAYTEMKIGLVHAYLAMARHLRETR